MKRERIQPLILGCGMAGQALRHALAVYPESVAPSRWLEREAPLPAPADPERTLLVLANPHALHAPRLLEAAEAGYRFSLCEKPAAVNLEQVEALAKLPVSTWICHGYRLLWGPQTLRQAVASGRFGEILSVEGRYWQSSATRARAEKSWKDDPALGGRFDVLLDLATHWVDLVTHVLGAVPDSMSVRRWFLNAPTAHRDTHVHVTMTFGDVVSFGSVSKTVHGAGNLLEIHVVGEKASAGWSFSRPDAIVWGEGSTSSIEVRSEAELPARPAPFHGLGWMEGYCRLAAEVVAEMNGERSARVATLDEHLAVLRYLLTGVDGEPLESKT